MGHLISLPLSEGTSLLRLLHAPGWKIGKEVGEKKFSDNIASQCNKRMHLFYKLLKKNSPLLRDEDKVCFGSKEFYDSWTRKPTKQEVDAGENPDKEVIIYELRDSKKTIDLDMTSKERDGLYWTIFLISHPSSLYCQGPAAQDALVWPLAEQIGMVGQLEEDLGLKKGEILELMDDEERGKKQKEMEAKEAQALAKGDGK